MGLASILQSVSWSALSTKSVSQAHCDDLSLSTELVQAEVAQLGPLPSSRWRTDAIWHRQNEDDQAADVCTDSDLQAPLLQTCLKPPHLRMTLMVCLATTSGAGSGPWQSPPGIIIWGFSKQASKQTPASTRV